MRPVGRARESMVKNPTVMSKILKFIVAGTLVSQALAETPAQQADALYKQGLSAERAGDPKAAAEAYTSALKLNPGHANARYNLGQVKINAGSIAAKGRETKFGAVMIPLIQFEGATLQEALDALSLVIKKESKEDVTPNFVIEDPKNQFADRKISLTLKNMPSKAVMKYILDQSGAKARYDEHAVVIAPL